MMLLARSLLLFGLLPIDMFSPKRRKKIIWWIAIAVFAAVAGVFVSWRVSGLENYAGDRLLRVRGPIEAPHDIVIVAIDETSIKRLGRFPWRRELTAQVLNKINEGKPRAIALDVLYSEPTDEANDKVLSDAITKAGNVIVATQLIEDAGEQVNSHGATWLKPLPEVENAAAGVGHVNIAVKNDGAAREVLLRLADEEGNARWAMAIETVRVGDRLGKNEIKVLPDAVQVGNRKIPFDNDSETQTLVTQEAGAKIESIAAQRMAIDYVGPTGSFAKTTYSFADVLDGKTPAKVFSDKYVLIGATAATLGEKIASPFVFAEDADSRQHGTLMPGVEVLANEINTILRSRFTHKTSDWFSFIVAIVVAALTLFALEAAQGRFETLKQILALALLCAGILLASYFVFTKFLLTPPLVPALLSFAAATPLGLLYRSFSASFSIEKQIEEISQAESEAVLGIFTSETGSKKNHANILPRGVEWKTEKLSVLQRNFLARSRFVDRALHSVADALLMAGADGKIVFANASASEIFVTDDETIIGCDLFSLFDKGEAKQGELCQEKPFGSLAKLFNEQTMIERELKIGHSPNATFYISRISCVTNADCDGVPRLLGYIATLTDITKQRELQQTKADVMALVTHEFRTPLTAIQGMSELLSQFDVTEARRREMHQAINDEAKRLARMVDEYLDIARLESGARKLKLEETQIAPLINRVLLLLSPVASVKNITLTRRIEPNLPPIKADADLLSLAITNLIANAIKFSQEKSEVVITAQTKRNLWLEILVKDFGCGVPSDSLPYIFEKFYRAPCVEEQDVPGSGLGLSLAREIAEQHGGSVNVESEPGIGSVFTLRLPTSEEGHFITDMFYTERK